MDDKALREAIRRRVAHDAPKTDLIDYIEELEAVYEAAVNDAFEAEAYAEELEAKLAKAVVFAEIVERAGHGALWPLALDILAELKGQNDD